MFLENKNQYVANINHHFGTVVKMKTNDYLFTFLYNSIEMLRLCTPT